MADQPDAPTIDAVGVDEQATTFSDDHTAATVADASQTIEVTGPAGADVHLLRVDGSRVQMSDPNDPAWEPFDVEDYEANKAVAIEEYDVTIGNDGTVDVPVTLTDTGNEEAPNASGLNHFVAVVDDGATTSANSNVVILELDEPTGQTVVHRINAGGPQVDYQDATWDADNSFEGGKAYTNTQATVPTLYQTERSATADLEPFDYAIDVTNGTYTVNLHFAEIYFGADGGGSGGTGQRVLSANLEGGEIELPDYDINADVGPQTPVVKSFQVDVNDGTLDIAFTASVNQPKVSAIEILTAGAAGNDAPVANDDNVTVEPGNSVVIDVLANDTDVDGTVDATTVDLTSAPTGGTANVDPVTGEVTYNAEQGFEDAGSDTFTYTVDDDEGATSNEATVTVTDSTVQPAGVLYRVNAGGAAVAASDDGGDWTADTEASPSEHLANAGSNSTSDHGTVGSTDSTVPASTPSEVFTVERWDNTTDGAGEMAWAFPVDSGSNVEVRLYFRNGYAGTSASGERVFDVVLEGSTVLDDYDIAADVGHDTATMKSFVVPSDGSIDLEFLHEVENPLVNAIEIVTSEPQPNQLDASSAAVNFGQVLVGSTADDTVTISNLGDTGDPDITVSDVAVTNDADGEFAATLNGSATIPAGESRTIDVAFTPGDDGAEAATLDITHSGDNSPTQVDLTGDGTNDVSPAFSAAGLSGEQSGNPTSLEFGPDGRLYVAQQNGTIYAYTVQRNNESDYQVTDTETINEVKGLPNHNDDGTPSGTSNRQVTGLMTAGTAANPVLYVTSSDPRIGGGGGGADSNLDTNSGIISRLTLDGSTWDHVQLVRGLPRSEENHSTNGMDLDVGSNTLYVAQGGHDNKGAPSNNFAGTPEYALSAAILNVDLDAIEALPVLTDSNGNDYVYDLPTLDDPTRSNTGSDDPNDPFGGNNGRNQARLVTDGPVQIASAGYRNPYDVELTEAGELYTWDNGPNSGWGGVPVNEGSAGQCTNEFNESNGSGYGDGLHHITGSDYYGGHPNPTRANPNSGLYVYVDQGDDWELQDSYDWSDFPEPPVPAGSHNPVECDYLIPGQEDGTQVLIGSSTNGMAEYTASNFGGAMQGDLLVASFNGNVYRVQLDANGDTSSYEALFSGFGNTPLDVAAQGDNDVFPGTIWAATYGSDSVTVFEPQDFGSSCSGADDPSLDEDNDGYTNADEIDNGTNPCSAGSVPDDFDGDGVSDLNDDDDDDDGIDDVDDAFAIDADNGLSTDVPVERELFNNTGSGFFGIGFTGLMTNGTTDYLDQFDETKLAAGGTSGLLTVEEVTGGDAYTSTNTQDNAFQYGVNVDANSDPFVVHGQLESTLFEGMDTPENYQAYGIQMGTGSQDDYLKVVLNANGGDGGIQVLLENDGSDVSSQTYEQTTTGDVLAATSIDLYFAVDPAAGTAQPQLSLDGGATMVDLGDPISLPSGWLTPDDGQALAVGVISTANAQDGTVNPYGATWDFLNVESGSTDPGPTPDTAAASIAITPTAGINASTYGSGSFSITNDSTDGQLIEAVSFDLSSSLLPDLVFDPNGTAGDTTAKCLTADSGAGATGHVAPGDNCTDPFSSPHNGTDGADGYDTATVDFTDFAPGETFGFSVDNDPTSIKGASAPGPNEAGSVSGLELAGATVTVTFDDGTELTTNPFANDTDGGSEAVAAAGLPDAPGISLQGETTPTTVSDANQTVAVTGPDGAMVRLLRVEAGLFEPSGGGYDIDAFEANSAVAVEVLADATISGGSVDIPVTLTRADDASGLNHLMAVVVDDNGDLGATSETLVVEYDPDAGSSSPAVHRLNAGGSELAAGDGGPVWGADGGSGSTFLVAGGDETYSTTDAITQDASVAADVPDALFQQERYDTAAGGEMAYSFPVDNGDYEVRVYLAEIYLTADNGGPRVFDIEVEGSVPASMDDVNAFEQYGHDVGFMLSSDVTVTDGAVDVDFLHGQENPAVKGIEVVALPSGG